MPKFRCLGSFLSITACFRLGDTAQVDFGQGPKITDVHTGEQFKTWFFIMTLA